MTSGARGFSRAWKQSRFSRAWKQSRFSRARKQSRFSRAISIAALASISATGLAQNTQPALAGNAEAGKKLYEKNTCFFCHGTAGQGGTDGARLALVARNLQSFTRYVRQPTGRMPAFTDKILSDQELADIFAYLRSLPQAKAVKDIPLLEQLRK
jgi:mono/diheme cytochrome c family protein